MKKASIVSIGNEILNGEVVDTNIGFLSRQLLGLGIKVAGAYTAADDVEKIARSLRLASEEGDIILATGGLGPTDDDVTREALAEVLGVELRFDEGLCETIREFFASRGRQMVEKNKVQAFVPEGAEPLANELGTAPGIWAKKGEKVFAVMPGVPAEMEVMFEKNVVGRLRAMAANQAIFIRKLMCFGTGESNIAEVLGDLMKRGRNPEINSTASCGVITLHIVATGADEAEARRMAGEDEALLREKLGNTIYGVDGETLGEVVGKELARLGKTIATAESCTGGLVAKLLTDVPGASGYFSYGWVTYGNEAKMSELGVDEQIIVRYGAASEEVASAMASAAREKARSDFGIGISGIAGPTGGSEGKPIGLVYISVCSDNMCDTERFIFSHGRQSVRLRAAQTALNMLRLRLF